jgi:hypothetical protein
MSEVGATPKKKRKQGIPKRMPMEPEERLDYHIRINKVILGMNFISTRKFTGIN